MILIETLTESNGCGLRGPLKTLVFQEPTHGRVLSVVGLVQSYAMGRNRSDPRQPGIVLGVFAMHLILNAVMEWAEQEKGQKRSKEYNAALANLKVAIRNVLKFW